MSLYWLEPGWTSAVCPGCGCNIWNSGGDPDLGMCFDCLNAERNARQQQEYPPCPQCDICENGDAVTAINNYAVCSKECADIAETREAQETRKGEKSNENLEI